MFRHAGFEFYFFAMEESRMHVHVERAEMEAKFWIEPRIELAQNHSMDKRTLRRARELIEEHHDEIRDFWKAFFKT